MMIIFFVIQFIHHSWIYADEVMERAGCVDSIILGLELNIM